MALSDVSSPISAYLASPEVSEIMVNGTSSIYIEEHGKLRPAEKRFTDEADLLRVLRQLLTFSGKTLAPQTPLLDARLEDGSRLTITAPPVTASICFTIRRRTYRSRGFAELVRQGTLSEPMAQLLKSAVLGRKNILISGGTSSGKTTLLNALAGEIPLDQRIVTIEDTFEISLPHKNSVAMETVFHARGERTVDMRTLVGHALHLRPDRILLGECRGGEALDILQAMNSGHNGSLATIHASSPMDVISRLETLVLMAGYEIPLPAIRQQIARAVNLIVQIHRTVEGQRQVTSICEIQGLKDGHVVLQPLFVGSGDEVGSPIGQTTGTIPPIVVNSPGVVSPAK